jgi:predicted dehydrogenase
MLKIGLIGAGWHATADHAPALRHCADSDEFRGRVELSAVCDIDRAKATDVADRFGFRRAYDSVEAMLPDVDAVLSIIPAAALAATLEPILRHRLPVLIEKPLGRDLGEARLIAATLAGHPHMVSLNRRFDPAVTIARQWLARQSAPRVVHGIMMRVDRVEPDFAWSTGIHLTDLLCSVAGPLRITRGRRDRVKRLAQLAGGGGSGMRGVIEISPTAGRVEEMVHVLGEGWSVQIGTGSRQPWRVLCRRGDDVEVDAAVDPATPAFIRSGAADETAAFLRSVLNTAPLSPTAADAMPGTELAAALQAMEDTPTYHGMPQ